MSDNQDGGEPLVQKSFLYSSNNMINIELNFSDMAIFNQKSENYKDEAVEQSKQQLDQIKQYSQGSVNMASFGLKQLPYYPFAFKQIDVQQYIGVFEQFQNSAKGKPYFEQKLQQDAIPQYITLKRVQLHGQQIKDSDYKITRSGASVGRNPENQIILQDEQKTISSKHFQIQFAGNQFLIQDLGSTSGTFIRIPTSSQEYLIKNGIYEFGIVEYQVLDYTITGDNGSVTLKMLYSQDASKKGSVQQLTVSKSKPFVIGSDNSCDLCIQNEKKISQKHCQIQIQNQMFMINDLRSDNGTWMRLSESRKESQPCQLKDGAYIKVSSQYCYQVQYGFN